MNILDSVPQWIRDMVKHAVKFDDKGEHHPEHPAAKLFDDKTVTPEKGHTSADFTTKKEFDKREVGNPPVESKFPEGVPAETDKILDKPAEKIKEPKKYKFKLGETTSVIAPSLGEEMIMKVVEELPTFQTGHIYSIDKMKDAPDHGKAGHEYSYKFVPSKVKAYGNFVLLKHADSYALVEYKDGIDKEGALHIAGLMEDEANLVYAEKVKPFEAEWENKIAKQLGLTVEAVQELKSSVPGYVESLIIEASDNMDKEWYCLNCGSAVSKEDHQKHLEQDHKLELIDKK